MSTYQSNIASTFIDLATFDALEQKLYSGLDSITYFVRQHKKATWFAQTPVVLSNASGTADFGNDWSVTISRAGDYLLHNWLSVTTPALAPAADTANFWVKNLMHNLVKEVSITFNDLTAMRIESTQLDFWAAFSTPASKKNGYRNMTGYGVETLSANGRDNVFLHGLDASVAHKLQLPLPFFFTRDSGVSLPTAALPYNDMRINFTFRTAAELLTAFDLTGAAEAQIPAVLGTTTTVTNPSFGGKVSVWANYAVVSNDERALMGRVTREIVIEQFQSAPITNYTNGGTSTYDIRFSSAVKALFFGLRRDHSDDTTVQTGVGITGAGGDRLSGYDTRVPANEAAGIYERKSPLETVTLLYENTTRLGSVPSAYFNSVNPYYHAQAIPSDEPGMHMYSYGLDLMSVDPTGSTNYGRLTNVTIVPTETALAAANTDWKIIVNAIVYNVAKISGGAFGFPIL
jgi:hypothetical protein